MIPTLRIALLAAAVALGGCGNKGPLVLPTRPAAPAPAETAPAPASADVAAPVEPAEPPSEPPPPPKGDG